MKKFHKTRYMAKKELAKRKLEIGYYDGLDNIYKRKGKKGYFVGSHLQWINLE